MLFPASLRAVHSGHLPIHWLGRVSVSAHTLHRASNLTSVLPFNRCSTTGDSTGPIVATTRIADAKSRLVRSPEALSEVAPAAGGSSQQGEASAASTSTSSDDGAQQQGVYQPRVNTWGVFPRPADISKAYGGGRDIRPGQELETAVGDEGAR